MCGGYSAEDITEAGAHRAVSGDGRGGGAWDNTGSIEGFGVVAVMASFAAAAFGEGWGGGGGW